MSFNFQRWDVFLRSGDQFEVGEEIVGRLWGICDASRSKGLGTDR